MRRLTEREVSTLLGGLRALQGGEHLDDLHEHFKDFEQLDDGEIERLCEQLNADDTVLMENSDYLDELLNLLARPTQYEALGERTRQLLKYLQDEKWEEKLPTAIDFMDRLTSIVEKLDDPNDDIEALVHGWLKVARKQQREAIGVADNGQVYCPTCREETELNLIEDALAFWPVYGIGKETEDGKEVPALAVGPSEVDLETSKDTRIECLQCNGIFRLPVGVDRILWSSRRSWSAGE